MIEVKLLVLICGPAPVEGGGLGDRAVPFRSLLDKVVSCGLAGSDMEAPLVDGCEALE